MVEVKSRKIVYNFNTNFSLLTYTTYTQEKKKNQFRGIFKLTCIVIVASLKSLLPFFQQVDRDFSFVARKCSHIEVQVLLPVKKNKYLESVYTFLRRLKIRKDSIYKQLLKSNGHGLTY